MAQWAKQGTFRRWVDMERAGQALVQAGLIVSYTHVYTHGLYTLYVR